MHTATFYRAVMDASANRRRDEANAQVAAQLPGELTDVWRAGEQAGRKPVKLHRQALYQRVMKEAGLGSTRDARWMTLAVLGALKESLSPGEAEDVFAQLPKDLKELWTEAQVPA